MTFQTQKTINVFIHNLHPSTLKLSAVSRDESDGFKLQLHEYPERAFLLVEPDDYIILNHPPDQAYLDYLIDIGIGTRNLLIPSSQGESLSEKVLKDKSLLAFLQQLGEQGNQVVLHPYMSTQLEAKIALKIKGTVNGPPPELSLKVNSKIYLPTLLHELALPVPEYEIVNSMKVLETAKKFIAQYDKIIVIGNHTYGGLAVWPIRNQAELNALIINLSQCNTEELFLIEKRYDVLCSPNIQYLITQSAIQELGLSDQILDQAMKHHGNTYPSSATQLEILWRDSRRLCEALQAQGYRGLLGIDFIETTEGQVFAVDINGRANASSFGLYVLRKLFPDSYPEKHLIMLTHINIGKPVTFTELTEILGQKNLFDQRQGILPYNTGLLQWGKFSAIIIANTQAESERLQRLLKRLSISLS
ncbi:MAG: ATP-grasp domain-containing protein [Candidatus Parabeggiatoa sp.]|nr:ATP-grasp domain-containing protein [Candidatus Parabeggiatoa sp.]